jgi:hypothetical protein
MQEVWRAGEDKLKLGLPEGKRRGTLIDERPKYSWRTDRILSAELRGFSLANRSTSPLSRVLKMQYQGESTL